MKTKKLLICAAHVYLAALLASCGGAATEDSDGGANNPNPPSASAPSVTAVSSSVSSALPASAGTNPPVSVSSSSQGALPVSSASSHSHSSLSSRASLSSSVRSSSPANPVSSRSSAAASSISSQADSSVSSSEPASISLVYEAEEAGIFKGVIETEHPGFSGTGFVNYDNANDSYIEWTITGIQAGPVELSFKYANGTPIGRPMAIRINSQLITGSLAFDSTGNWDNWAIQTIMVQLEAGTNVIRATSATSNGGPNVDWLQVSNNPGSSSSAVSVPSTSSSSADSPESSSSSADSVSSAPSSGSSQSSLSSSAPSSSVAISSSSAVSSSSQPSSSVQSSSASSVFTGEVGTVMFVGQVPVQAFAARTSTFANHMPNSNTPKGGGLFIRYPDGVLRNLTQEAGHTNVAVREPTVHWSGNKAIFSMVAQGSSRWQMYEITGLGRSDTPTVTLVQNQPNYNNVSPFYGSDDRVLFTSDRPITGLSHHHPSLDEYESNPTVVAIYSLNPANGNMFIVQHSPSGSFSPFVDSFGRILFIKWDHLLRDQQVYPQGQFQPFTYADESAGASRVTGNEASMAYEIFPEPRYDLGSNMNTPYGKLNEHNFNHFMPWEVNQDGTGELTLNHVGRHELGLSYTHHSFNSDNNLTYQSAPSSFSANNYGVQAPGGMFHMKEDPRTPGRYYLTQAPEFATAAAGDILMMESGAPGVNPENIVVKRITNRSSIGHARNPLPMSDGRLLASVSTQKGSSISTSGAPFRLAVLEPSGQNYVVAGLLTDGIPHGSGSLWELEAVEVAPHTRPPLRTMESVPTVERAVFTQKGVSLSQMQTWLTARNLALIVIRDVTSRDRADRQQPFNLRVPDGVARIPKSGTVYDVQHFQIFQAEYLRGYSVSNMSGRRPIARTLPQSVPGIPHNGPDGSVIIAPDGSAAAFVPARRALSWQLTDAEGVGIVRERNWISFQPGEIRTCASCHGLNSRDQTNQGEPQNQPQALGLLLDYWKQL